MNDKTRVFLGVKWDPLNSVGLYVPGGKASYPGSVLMTAFLQKLLVWKVFLCVLHKIKPLLMAAKIAGVKNIYKLGGAQAIAALAFGTKTVSPVNKIYDR